MDGRLRRYGRARQQAEEVRAYLASTEVLPTLARKRGAALASCGLWFQFREYPRISESRILRAHTCKQHLLCPLCAILRAGKLVSRYTELWSLVHSQDPSLQLALVTLTVKNGPDLDERVDHLDRSATHFLKRRSRPQRSEAHKLLGGVMSFEVTYNQDTREWHPHAHLLCVVRAAQVGRCVASVGLPDHAALVREWLGITGDSFVVDVRPVDMADPVSAFVEVLKYAVKFSSLPPAELWLAANLLRGRRLIRSFGKFRGVDLAGVENPEDDDLLEGEPFVDRFYRYMGSGHYVDCGRIDYGVPGTH